MYHKKHYCVFCGKAQARIARHLESKHTKQDEIKDILTLDIKTAAGSKERLKRLARLRNLGNFHHNMKIVKVDGELAVWRRPSEHVVDPASYRPCPHCLGFVTKTEMWRHAKHCKFKDPNQKNQDCSMQSDLIFFINKVSSGASKELKALVLSSMQNDDITDIVREDELITTLGSALIESQGLRKGNLILTL